MSEERVKIGFVGVGGMGQCAHLKNYATLETCEVVALAEIREDLGRKVALRYGVPRVYRTHEEMLAGEKLDGIVASQPFSRHGVLIPNLYTAGVPIFSEKPLAASVQVGERILRALQASEARHMVGYHKRSDPATMQAVRTIRGWKESGELGKMTYVRILMPAGDWVANGFTDLIRDEGPYPQLEWDPPAEDMDEETFKQYTIFVNYYIHQVNLMRFLLGAPYTVEYADEAGRLLVGRSEQGVTCTIEMTPYQTSIDWQESAVVCFEKGWLQLDLPAPLASNRPGRLRIFRDPGNGIQPVLSEPQLPWVHAMRQQAINFIAAIRGECPPPCEAAEALEDLVVARDYIRHWLKK
jgi:predicted dehydrogenase